MASIHNPAKKDGTAVVLIRGKLRDLLTIAIVLVAPCSRLFAQDTAAETNEAPKLPEHIRSILSANADELRTLTLRWKTTRGTPLAIDDLFKRLDLDPPEDNGGCFLAPEVIEFKQQNGKVRFRYEYSNVPFAIVRSGQSAPKTVKLQRSFLDIAFDGTKLYRGSPRLSSATPGFLTIDTIEDSPSSVYHAIMDINLERPNYFYQTGLKAPTCVRDFQAPALRSVILDMLDKGFELTEIKEVGVAEQKTISVTLKHSMRLYEFVLDSERGYAVVRRTESSTSGQPFVVAEMSDFVKPFPGREFWIPRSCRVTNYQWGGKPENTDREVVLVTEDYEVSDISNQPIPETEFVVSYDIPGLAVGDGTLPNAEKSKDGYVHYVMPADPKDLDKTIQRAIEGKPADVGGDHFRPTLIVANLILVSLLVGGFVFSKYRKSRSS